MIERLREKGIRNEAVLNAMAAVPRHIFVEEALASRAYEDTALPLGMGQTISQPFVVARMIELLLSGRASLGKTLEIGAGCGYQAAVLAQLTNEVYSVERLGPLLEKAKANIRTLQQFNVRLKHADGQFGLPEAAPFDSIIVAERLNVNPTLNLEIGVHSDARDGADAIKLDQRRADAIADYLATRGVKRDRVTAKGYGITRLTNPP